MRPGDTAHQERGDVQALPHRQVVTQQHRDLRIEPDRLSFVSHDIRLARHLTGRLVRS
jgi:hypothetical protein